MGYITDFARRRRRHTVLMMMRLVLLLSVMPYLVLGSVRSSCNDCPLPTDLSSDTCAIVFEDKDCGKAALIIPNNRYDSSMSGFWDDNIDTLVVRPGCTFKGWADANYHGDLHEYYEWSGCHDLTDWFENDISSYKCDC